MKQNKDAYGQEIWAYYKGRRSFEIAERDDGFIEVTSGPQSYFREYKDWPEQEKRGIKYARGKVLDVGCGAGRHSLYLQKKNFNVIGIDNSPLAIKVCKLRGVKKAKLMSIAEVGEFKPNSFDTIIMMCANFGLFGSPKRAKTLLKKIYKITSPDAIIIADINDPYKTNNPNHLEYHKFNKKRGRMPGQLRIRIRFEKYVGEWFDYLLVSKKELKQIIKETGWQVKKFIDSGGASYAAIMEKV